MPMGGTEMAAAPEIVEPEELNAEEFRTLIERRIRQHFRMSLKEFVEAVKAGKLGDHPAATQFAMLVGARPSSD
jgi:hypothetical protein